MPFIRKKLRCKMSIFYMIIIVGLSKIQVSRLITKNYIPRVYNCILKKTSFEI